MTLTLFLIRLLSHKFENAKKASVKHTPNWARTPLSFPRISEGMADDKRKIHANEWMNTIMSSRETNHVPIMGVYMLM